MPDGAGRARCWKQHRHSRRRPAAGRRRIGGISNSRYTRVEITKPVPIRSVIASHGVGSAGFRALLSPSTAAPIASQKTSWNDQKIRTRHRGSESRRAVMCDGATPVAFARYACPKGWGSMGVAHRRAGRSSTGCSVAGRVAACDHGATSTGLQYDRDRVGNRPVPPRRVPPRNMAGPPVPAPVRARRCASSCTIFPIRARPSRFGILPGTER